jgi:hypothetical protein
MRASPRSLLLLAALGLPGCSDTFTPASVVTDLRVLAIVADPPELRPSPTAGGNTILHAVAVAPPASPAAPGAPPRSPSLADEAWTFCPFSVGASTGYACAIPDCEATLLAAGDGTALLDPLARLAAPKCRAALGFTPGGVAGLAGSGAVEMLVRYQATLDGVRREAVQRIPVWIGAPPADAPNLNPSITAFTTGDDCSASTGTCSKASVSVEVTVDPALIQTYTSGGRVVDEEIVVSFFTTAGRFKNERGQATRAVPTTGTTLEAKDLGGAREAWVWAVARDLRGGEAVAGPLRVVFSAP